jgi:hypothetical protein
MRTFALLLREMVRWTLFRRSQFLDLIDKISRRTCSVPACGAGS